MVTKTTLNDLCVDVLLCIFDYFTIDEIYAIFSEAIPNLTSLLIDSRIQVHVRNPIIPPINPGQVTSIDLQCLSRLFSSSLSDFTNLRAFTLRDIEDPQLLIDQPLSQSLRTLYLHISLRHKPGIVLRLLPLITQLKQLRSYTLIYPSSYFVVQKDTLVLQQSSISMKNIKLDLKCSIDSLEKLLYHLPYLQRLQTFVESNPENIRHHSVQISRFPTVQYLSLLWDYIPFRDILVFCQKMMNLKQCIFNVDDHRYDRNVFNPFLWRQFIERDHPLLNVLIVNMKYKPTSIHSGISHQSALSIKDPYFHSINFKFNNDHRRNLVVEGHYVK